MSAKYSANRFRVQKIHRRDATNPRGLVSRRFFKRSGHRHDRRTVIEMLRIETEDFIAHRSWYEPQYFFDGYRREQSFALFVGCNRRDGHVFGCNCRGQR